MVLTVEKRKTQQGSIMLEVIAVLALMGVMGAMLFRQIYQRNQELHNIQMASEIRTVKEAFAAYIQAHSAEIQTTCAEQIPPVCSTGTPSDPCNNVNQCAIGGLSDNISEYLPDGWFSDGGLGEYYNPSLWIYRQNDDTAAVKIYGVVFPTTATIPATGWNFKRAARVALLIGADGGVYGEPTNDEIAGSLGTWHLDKIDGMEDADYHGAVYAATTGFDVFTPEYEKQQAKVTLSKDLDLQVRKLNAYGHFSVGNATGCYSESYINHNTAEVDSNGVSIVNPDEVHVPPTCLPTFWVEADENGSVYTRNDLNVGYDQDDPANSPAAIRLTKEGAIFFADSGPDAQDNGQERRYLLDPAYTSILNDVKLTSRGGASLSEILPNYILKTQKEIASGGGAVEKPDCPTGYKKALVVLPTTWDKRELTVDIPALTLNDNDLSDDRVKTESKEIDLDDANTNNEITIPQLKVSGTTFSYPNVSVKNDTGLCVQIAGSAHSMDTVAHNSTGLWSVTLGKNNGGSCTPDSSAKAVVQTYCVFDKDNFKDDSGNTLFLPSTATRTEFPTTNSSEECKKLGGKNWDSTTHACTIS